MEDALAPLSTILNQAWTKVASAGANVIVQNLGNHPILLAASATPPGTDAGVHLDAGGGLSGVLASDLYARSIQPIGTVLVADGFFTIGSGATTGGAIASPGGAGAGRDRERLVGHGVRP